MYKTEHESNTTGLTTGTLECFNGAILLPSALKVVVPDQTHKHLVFPVLHAQY